MAERFSVPVLLHTGFSPFPGSSVDPSAYDPIYLTDVIKAYDGLSGRPLVEFVLAHSGQGDMRSVHHALEICRDNPNVYIDISALKRGFLIDIDGNQIPEADQIDSQLPYILEKIKTFGIIDRTLFATDGPQYPGMVAGYLSLCIEEMKSANFTLEEIEKVLYSNTCDLFLKE